MCFYELITALLTAQNIPLIDWSKTTFNNVLLQGVKMYLQALNDGFVVLEPAQNIPLIDWSKTTFNNWTDDGMELTYYHKTRLGFQD